MKEKEEVEEKEEEEGEGEGDDGGEGDTAGGIRNGFQWWVYIYTRVYRNIRRKKKKRK